MDSSRGLADRAAQPEPPQTDLRLAGQHTIPDRRVSLVDLDARPIRMGSPRRPTEFGYKAVVADTADGFVIAEVPQRGGPVGASLLEGAIGKAKQAGMQVRSVYADRGFGTSTGDAALARHRIRDPIIPGQQRAAPIEHSRSWKPLPLPQRARRPHLATQAEGPAPHPLTRPRLACRPGSAASALPTTFSGWRSSPALSKALTARRERAQVRGQSPQASGATS